MISPETSASEPSEAEVSAAAEAAISYMLANKADQRPAIVTAIHLVRAVLVAAAQVRAQANPGGCPTCGATTAAIGNVRVDTDPFELGIRKGE